MSTNELHSQFNDIAIVGMAGRFPTARDLDAYWQLLCEGREGISFFSDDELRAAGVQDELLRHPAYVKAGAVLDEIEYFDAPFFEYTPRMAEIMNPQQRLFLECAWQALEHAGYNPATYQGAIGVYASSSRNGYLARTETPSQAADPLQALILNDKDFVAPLVSYKLNLRGPSLNVQTACSSSLVAVHLACQGLLGGECDLALAGGVSVRFLHKNGYLYREGGIASPDGHCRAFDARARGTVSGDGVGIVVLKRLVQALEDHDTIHAIVKGSAVNNDGALKVGYTAPGIQGQAAVIAEAHNVADVQPETITYIEAHGTGTALGDPIEIAALTQAFRLATQRTQFCAVGSVKTNIGHLDAAAGIASLLKVVLALTHHTLPPSLHFTHPPAEIDVASSPFYVNATRAHWPAGATPRRAGVSSFGIGGTNAHVILEESAPPEPSHSSRPWHLLLLSARSEPALAQATHNLLATLKQRQELALGDICSTLQLGRKAFTYRKALVCATSAQAIQELGDPGSARVLTGLHRPAHRPLIFLFPGQGSHTVPMARTLYHSEPLFRQEIERCATLLRPLLKQDLRTLLFPADGDLEQAAQALARTELAQPALFVISYALARLWMAWGVTPTAMIGHSLGEYVAACLAGVLSLQEALELLVHRGRLMQSQPPGSMLAVALTEAAITPLLGAHLALAAVNAPARCVVSGTHEAIAALEQTLVQRDVTCQQLHTSHAFHSPLMEPILERFTRQVMNIRLQPARIPYLSNVTGTWITAEEATDPGYWAQHLRQTVRFAAGLSELLAEEGSIFLEVGPGTTLSRLVRQQPGANATHLVLASLERSRQDCEEGEQLLQAVGQLWLAGVPLDWERFHAHDRCRRVPLPSYPFERKRYWIERPGAPDPGAAAGNSLHQSAAQQDVSCDQETSTGLAAREKEAMQTSATSPHPPSHAGRVQHIGGRLTGLLGHALGLPPEEVDAGASFFELGADSLTLLQVSQAIQDTFGVKVGFRLLVDRYASIEALAAYLDEQLPPVAPEPAAPLSTQAAAEKAPAVAPPRPAPVPPDMRGSEGVAAPALSHSSLEHLFAQQLHIMSQQLSLLRGGQDQPAPRASADASPAVAARVEQPVLSQQIDPEVFVPYTPARQKRGAHTLSARQQAYLATFTRQLGERTARSKRMAQDARPFLADSRATFGFTLPFKELVYPIVVQRAAGARVWDVDSNEYVDLAMGFGALLFGHSPSFLLAALTEQAQQGLQLGMQSNLVGRVAQLLHELTGVERVAFCNSGTEAVMSALRLARAASGRTKIALFAGSFHGTFDGVLMRSREVEGGGLEAAPLAPGVPESIIGDVLALRFDTAASLDILRAHIHELAAVLVEPPQSRRPDLQPVAFIRALRQLTREAGVALIFDEVVTGFRTHPGGAQALMNVQADLVTYGKALGGGLPIGIVAGRAQYMDYIDGGMWQYGDDSYPHSEQTFFAGTYFKHPLIMAGILAVLTHLKEQGPRLQQDLNRRVQELVATLNTFFEQQQVAVRVVHYGSIFRFVFPPALKRVEESLFFYHLLANGIYCGEGRNCFLSTAHTARDIQQILHAVRESIEAMRAGGFALGPQPPSLPPAGRLPAAVAVEHANGQTQRTYPLTAQQQELWVLAHLDEEASRAYNEPLLLRLRGPLDAPALGQALEQVIARHEALRVTFDPDGSVQRVAPVLKLALPLIDLSFSPAQQRADMLAEQVRAAIGQPFDLERGPLLRAQVYACGEQEHLLLLVCHHSIADGASTGTLVQELSALYTASVQQVPPRLPAPGSYGSFIQWQAEQQQAHTAADEAYWQHFFAQPAPPLDLPTDRPRPPLKTYPAACCTLTVEAPLVAHLKAASAQLRTTLFLTLLATYTALLHRISGQETLITGAAVAGQALSGRTHLVGHCVNLLPVRSTLEPGVTFASFLASLHTTFLDAYDHQAFPFLQVMRSLKSARDPSRLPLINTAFNLDSAGELRFAALDAELLRPPLCFAKFDLDLNVTARGDILTVDCLYNTDLFEASTIQRWLQHFRTLLQAVATDPTCPVQALPLLTATERSTLLHEWSTPSRPFPEAACLHRLFEDRVLHAPQAIAAVFEEQQLTYQELNRRANMLAHVLSRQGVRPGALVGLCIARSLEMLIGLLGILKAGGGYVPLDPAYPPERLAFMLQDSQVAMLLTHSSLQASLPAFAGPVLCLDTDWQRGQRARAENPGGPATLDQRVCVMYTSGSTGQPKGVVLSHRAMANRVLWARHATPFTGKDRLLQTASLSFDIALWELLGPLCAGACVVLLRADDLLEIPVLVNLLCTQGITVLHAVPSLLHLLLEQAGIQHCTSIRQVYTGGEAVPADLPPRVFARLSAELMLFYGPTEAAINATAWPCPRSAQVQPVSLGQPIANMRVYLLDNQLQPVPTGIPGEIYIAGVGLAEGYLRRPGLTAERFLPHPFAHEPGERLYRTGDLARSRRDGQLEFLGRRDQQVKIRGQRVELHEIEAVLREHPAVEQAVALLRADHPGEQRLAAYLVLRAGQTLSAREILTFAARKLPAGMLPALCQVVNALPQTPNGKLDRRALLALPPESAPAARTATTPVERRLQEIWSEVLHLARVGIHENFFELGGDSLLGLRIITRANEAGLQVTAKQLFQHQTIAELAHASGSTPVVQVAQGVSGEQAPLTPVQQAFLALKLPEPQHFNQALLLVAQRPLNHAWLTEALAQLQAQHDTLRLRFSEGPAGWTQAVAPAGGEVPVVCLDLSALSERAQMQAIASRAAEIHASLDLQQGPLWRVAHFHLGAKTPARVLIVIHHLAVDIVSWSILLGDLQAAYTRRERGERGQVPPKTTSFGEWARRLQAYAQSPQVLAELPFWLADVRTRVRPLPTKPQPGINSVASEQTVAVALEGAQTRDLLTLVPGVAQMQTHDALLAALALALAEWSGQRVVLLDVERHGREQLFDDVILTRTVGWFTSVAPLVVDLRQSDRPADALRAVKEQLQRMPDGGIGYGLLRFLAAERSTQAKLQALPQAQVVLNYLGRSSQLVPRQALFVSAGASAGPPRSPHGLRPYLLDIEAVVRGERLDLYCRYSENVHEQASIERFARGIVTALQAVIEHCRTLQAGRTDAPGLAHPALDRRSFDAILSQVRFGDDE